MTGGSLVANGSRVSLTVSGTTTVSGASLYAERGGTLALSDLTSYQQPNNYGSELQASGADSLLSLSSVGFITLPNGSGAISLEAYSGGDVEIPLVTQLTGSIYLDTNSATSVLNVSQLTTFTGGTVNYGGGTLNSSGSTPNLPVLTDIDGSTINVSGGATLSPSTVTSAEGSDFNASGGSTLILSGLTSYQQPYSYGSEFQASGAGSLVSLPNAASITLPNGSGAISLEAYSGGDVEIPLVTQLTGSIYLDTNSATSVLNVSQLTTFTGGTVNYGGGTLNSSGSTPNLPVLTDIDGSTINVSGGATLSPSTVTSAEGSDFNASGGSTLILSGLTSYQ